MRLSNIALAISAQYGGLFKPSSLFTTGVNGAWYDPSDFSTLFQNAAGTMPVTAVEQPVGLMLDKRNGLVLGPELVINGDGSSLTGWTSVGSGSFSVSSGRFLATITGAPSTSGGRRQDLTVVAGKSYKVNIDIEVSTIGSGRAQIICYDGAAFTPELLNVQRTAAGTYNISGVVRPTQSTLRVYFVVAADSSTTTTAYFDNISVRELPGNHAYNPSGNSANFPVLQQDGTGRYYLAFNGVNQWLQTNSIDFTYGDKMFVSAGVRKLSDAAVGMLVELGATAPSGRFYIAAPYPASSVYGFNAKGTTDAEYAATGYSAPVTNILSSSYSLQGTLAQNVIPRVNGVSPVLSITAAGPAGGGNYGNYPLYIGARAGTSLWFNGRLYGLVVAGKQASASEIASTETWLNQKTGAY